MTKLNLYYNTSLYCGKDLKLAAEAYAAMLPSDVTMLVSGGSSGCAIASAMLVVVDRDLKHLSVYSDSHKSHRGVEKHTAGPYVSPKDVVAIVDDFIDSGKTIRSLSTRCNPKYIRRVPGNQALKYVLVFKRMSNSNCDVAALGEDIDADIIYVENDDE